MRLVIGYIYKKEDCDCRYFDGSNSAVAKIKSLKCDFESFDGVLFGRVRATLTEPLTEEEEAELKEFITGQKFRRAWRRSRTAGYQNP